MTSKQIIDIVNDTFNNQWDEYQREGDFENATLVILLNLKVIGAILDAYEKERKDERL